MNPDDQPKSQTDRPIDAAGSDAAAAKATSSVTVADWAAEEFVSLTTFKKNGEGVATPVWVVRGDGDELLVWTPANSWKVKRVRRDPTATIRPCSRRGAVEPDAPTATVSVQVRTDAVALRQARAGLLAKHGLQFRMITGIERVLAAAKRRSTERVVLVLRLADPAA